MSDAGYRLTSEQVDAGNEFGAVLLDASGALTLALMETGLPQHQAANVAVVQMLHYAATISCTIRRKLLGGEPDAERWRAATGAAFTNAVERTAALIAKEPTP